MNKYHETLELASLDHTAELKRFFDLTLDLAISRANALIDELVRQRLLTDDFNYKNVLAQGECSLDDLVDQLQDLK